MPLAGEEKDVPNDSNVSIENFEVGEKVSTTEVLKTLTFGNGKSILDSSDNDSGRRLKALILDLESSPRESSETISSTLCGVAKAKSMLIQYISRRYGWALIIKHIKNLVNCMLPLFMKISGHIQRLCSLRN